MSTIAGFVYLSSASPTGDAVDQSLGTGFQVPAEGFGEICGVLRRVQIVPFFWLSPLQVCLDQSRREMEMRRDLPFVLVSDLLGSA